MTDIYFWAIGTIVSAGFLLSTPRRWLFLLVLVPGVICFVALWIHFLAVWNCGDACPSGHDIEMGLVGLVTLGPTLIFVPVVLIKAIVLHRQERLR